MHDPREHAKRLFKVFERLCEAQPNNIANSEGLSLDEMEGALLDTLLRGGAYNKFPGNEDEARRLARDFVTVIGHEHAEVFKIIEAWTPWFYNVAWDLSFVVLNSRQMRWWILCMTDED